MKSSFKAGFGWTLGCMIAGGMFAVANGVLTHRLYKRAAHNKEFMTWVEKCDPKMFEQLKKYI